MTPFFSIVTPTLLRDTLSRCCDSVSTQSMDSWEQVLMIDTDTSNQDLLHRCQHPKRLFIQCAQPHKNFGNTCRHNAFRYIRGEYVLYLDDDNYLSDGSILRNMQDVLLTANKPQWALFPILRHGQRFFFDPPGNCYVDTANMVIRREFAKWPNRDEYTLDGIFCEELKASYNYVAYPAFRPIVIMEKSSEGK